MRDFFFLENMSRFTTFMKMYTRYVQVNDDKHVIKTEIVAAKNVESKTSFSCQEVFLLRKEIYDHTCQDTRQDAWE